MHALWLAAVFGIPIFFMFHWGLDTLRSNVEHTSARLIAALHFAFGLMLLTVYAIQVVPPRDDPVLGLYVMGTLGVLIAAFGVHLSLRVLRVMDRLPPGVGVAVAYVWTVPGLWTLVTGHNVFDADAFVHLGFWIDPLYNRPFHLAMWVAVGLSAVLVAALAWVRRRTRDPSRRGQIDGLLWGNALLGGANLFLGALLPVRAPSSMPPFPYLVGLLLWMSAVRIALRRYAYLPFRLQQYHHLFSLTPAPLLMVDGTGRIVDRNPTAVHLVGSAGDSLADLLSADQRDVLAQFRTGFARRRPIRGREITLRGSTGDRWMTAEGDYVTVDGTTYCILVLHDLTEERERQAQLAHMAYHDDLTTLPNAAQFYQRVAEALADGPGHWDTFALAILDLDNFKQINDTWGHQAGDAVLVELARRLARQRRGTDVVSRLGGDEFGVLLAQVPDRLGAESAAERLLAAVRTPIIVGPGVSIDPTISVGLCLYPSQRHDRDSLIRAADIAMYQAKHAGKNRAYVFQEDWAHDGPLGGAARSALATDPARTPAGLA